MSEQTTHTPGPWRLEVDDKGRDVIFNASTNYGTGSAVLDDPGTEVIAIVYKESDTRLISAAPELLAELIHANRFIEKYARSEMLADGAGLARRHIAIDKATGRE